MPKPAAIPTIESIDEEIAGGFRGLLFKPDLERRHEEDVTPFHKSHLLVASVIGLIFYDLFLFNDWKMLNDVFWTGVIFRLAIFTPVAVVGIALLKTRLTLKIAEIFAGFVAVLAVVLIMVLYSMSNSIYRPISQYGPLMITVFAAVVQRIRFRYCLPTAIAIIGVQLLTTFYAAQVDETAFEGVLTIYMTVSILVLLANYEFEHERRRSYLLSLRGQCMVDQLDRYGKIDPLTGLWNRRHLNAIMKTAWAEADASPKTMAVILLDIDRFKLFNDTYGHLEGDICLQRIGAVLRKALDSYGEVAVRFGGEEFLIFIAGMDAASARAAAYLVQQAIRLEAMPYPALGEGSIVTASIGVATGSAPGVSAGALMRAADAALYDAKHAGRDRIWTTEVEDEACDPSMTAASGAARAA